MTGTSMPPAPAGDGEDAIAQIGHWIGGAPVAGASGRTGPVYNPATGAQTGAVGLAGTDEVDRAVAAARAAFPAWRALSLTRRVKLLFRMRQLVDEHARELAETIADEHGKVVEDALGEISRAVEVLEVCCGLPELLKGGFSEQVSGGIDVYSMRQPLGVVAGVTPFNFPAMVPVWMWGPALACGNTFVWKPSEKVPSAALLLARLLTEAGLPDGVFNVVQGDATAAGRLLEHPEVDAFSFVGSTPVARHVYATGTAAGKRVQALGGAKNHMVVLEDAQLDAACDAAISAAYGSAGERCMAISVVVAVGEIADPLVEGIASRIAGVRVGPGREPTSDMGPLVTRAHRDRVAGYLDGAAAQGATIVADGRDLVSPDGGFFLGPCLLDHVTPEMTCYQEEIFGPVLCVVRVPTYDAALELLRANPFGNGAAIFTRDGGAARRFQFEATCGMIGINVPIPVPVAQFSFGGWKDSLFGSHHIYGPDGMAFYTRGKVVTSRWPRAAAVGADFSFPSTG